MPAAVHWWWQHLGCWPNHSLKATRSRHGRRASESPSTALSCEVPTVFTYTPNPGFIGTDSFAYEAFDGTSPSFWSWAFVTVNVAPVAVPDHHAVLNDRGRLTGVPAPGVLANDTDINGDGAPHRRVAGRALQGRARISIPTVDSSTCPRRATSATTPSSTVPSTACSGASRRSPSSRSRHQTLLLSWSPTPYRTDEDTLLLGAVLANGTHQSARHGDRQLLFLQR